MATGRKTGGRRAGTPNKRTQARRLGVEELLAKYRYDPLEAMIAEASDPGTDPEVRRGLHREIAPYVYPKRKSVEAKVEDLSTRGVAGMTPEEIERRAIEILRAKAPFDGIRDPSQGLGGRVAVEIGG